MYSVKNEKVMIYVCESANSSGDGDYHKKPHVFAVIDDSERLPFCPKCLSQDNIYEHAIGELSEVKVLNQDKVDLEDEES